MLGVEDMRVKEHLIRNSVRITSWSQMRGEILEIQQYIDSQPVPLQLGANPKSKGRGKDGKGKGKGKDVKGKGKGKDVKTKWSNKARSDDQKKWFYCNKTGHVKAECRKPCRLRRKAGGRDATSERHSDNDCATAVLAARREPHDDVHSGNALRERRDSRQVFQ